MSASISAGIEQHFGEIEDPRIDRTKLHKLVDILAACRRRQDFNNKTSRTRTNWTLIAAKPVQKGMFQARISLIG